MFSELYQANGASNGYGSLNQLTDFRRGTLSDTNSDNIPDTVTTPSRTQSWRFVPFREIGLEGRFLPGCPGRP